MRHLIHGRKLGRKTQHRKAMLANLAMSIIDKERVTTTVQKAKEVRAVVERLITYAKKGSLHAIRLAARTVNDKVVLTKLFEEIAPRFKERQGGYVRIIRTTVRKGDNAQLCIIEFVVRPLAVEPIETKTEGKNASKAGGRASTGSGEKADRAAKRAEPKAADGGDNEQKKPAKNTPPKRHADRVEEKKDTDKGRKTPKKSK
jgi:large subunit ribosomal protein L17